VTYFEVIYMSRTTLDLPDGLIEEAQHLLGFKSKTDVVILGLKELIRKKRIEELKSLAGNIELEIDLKHSREKKKINKRVNKK
jgi:hypothetical protein